jgi:hypothetical protein
MNGLESQPNLNLSAPMFRFTIRDVLWLMVVVGLSLGWWQAERRSADQANRLVHLRANFDEFTEIAKEFGLYTKRDAERQQVAIGVQVPAKEKPVNLSGMKDAEVVP